METKMTDQTTEHTVTLTREALAALGDMETAAARTRYTVVERAIERGRPKNGYAGDDGLAKYQAVCDDAQREADAAELRAWQSLAHSLAQVLRLGGRVSLGWRYRPVRLQFHRLRSRLPYRPRQWRAGMERALVTDYRALHTAVAAYRHADDDYRAARTVTASHRNRSDRAVIALYLEAESLRETGRMAGLSHTAVRRIVTAPRAKDGNK